MTDHVTLRLHTGELYLTNYVTSEDNWLHQILFRGLHAPLFHFLFFEIFSTPLVVAHKVSITGADFGTDEIKPQIAHTWVFRQGMHACNWLWRNGQSI